ncbi:MAG: hypothetical protein ACUZ77_08880 [Candidatus Brocadiales bacterium]
MKGLCPCHPNYVQDEQLEAVQVAQLEEPPPDSEEPSLPPVDIPNTEKTL